MGSCRPDAPEVRLQALVAKAYEVRVTVVDQQLYAAAIHDHDANSVTDHRRSDHLAYRVCEVPASVAERTLRPDRGEATMTRPAPATDGQPADVVAARAAMVDQLVDDGVVTDPRLEDALRAVPRELLVPEVLADPNGVRGPVLRDDPQDPAERAAWLARVYSNKTLMIETHEKLPRTSGTMPGLMAVMIAALSLQGDENVLEIGTGTGYTTGLLCHVLGQDHVASVDVEIDLVRHAAVRLDQAGYRPALHHGDGTEGWPARAPYDRILATCGLRHVPAVWMEQLRDGGRIVAPLRGALAEITRTGSEPGPDTRAEGRFHDQVALFMPLRPTTDPAAVEQSDRSGSGPVRRSSALGPFDTFYHRDIRFLLDLALPDLHLGQHSPGLENLTVEDDLGNAAHLHPAPDGKDHVIVEEHGARPIWRQVEDTVALWHTYDQPGRSRFGITLRGTDQTVWLDRPDGPTWRLVA